MTGVQTCALPILIRELGQSHTVIFSSHILSEVQSICDQVLIINKGHLIAFDEPKNLEQQLLTPNEIRLTTNAQPVDLDCLLSGLQGITGVTVQRAETGLNTVVIQSDCENIYELSRRIFRCFAESRFDLMELSLKKANLEDIFLELTDDKNQPVPGPAAGEDAPVPAEPEPESEVEQA